MMPYRVLVDGGLRWGWVGRRPPVVVSFGGGVDSTAMLVGMAQRAEPVDAVVFAAVGDFRRLPGESSIEVLASEGKSRDAEGRQRGDEHPETYDHLARFDRWLLDVGLPGITVLVYVHAQDRYGGLYKNLIANGSLPSISFGRHSCSLKHKGENIDRWVRKTYPDVLRIERLIGYDAGSRDQGRSCRTFRASPGADFSWRAPLQEWGWERERCEEVCREAVGYVPPKSSCYFCGAKKPEEISALPILYPDLAERCREIEAAALPKLRQQDRGLSGRARKGRRLKDGTWKSLPRPGRWTDIWGEELAAGAPLQRWTLRGIDGRRRP